MRYLYLLMAILSAFFGVSLVYAISGNPYEEYQLVSKGLTTLGYIIDVKVFERSGEENTSHFFTYNYIFKDANGKEISSLGDDRGYPPPELINLERPYPIQVVYLKDNPEINKPKKIIAKDLEEFFKEKLVLQVLGFILFSTIAFYCLFYFKGRLSLLLHFISHRNQ